MIKTAFGNMVFNVGWKTKTIIKLFNIEYEITVKLKAVSEQQAITEEQNKVCEMFCENKTSILQKVENMLKSYGNEENFVPTTLLIKRNGDYAILFDDKQDIENGIAVCLAPSVEILMQDQYL